MADNYEKNRAFGKPENIEKRLAMWHRQLSMDRSFPWVGLGLIDDLKCACRMLGGDPDKQYGTDMHNPKPAPAQVTADGEDVGKVEDRMAAAETVYDL